jgi:mono/diheme cytochrome c family protein
MNLLWIAVSLLLVSCGSSNLQEALPTGVAANGGSVFTSNCQSCHGATGTGGTGPNIQSSSSATIQSAVRSGPSSMPSYSQSEISSQQLADLIAYIATL